MFKYDLHIVGIAGLLMATFTYAKDDVIAVHNDSPATAYVAIYFQKGDTIEPTPITQLESIPARGQKMIKRADSKFGYDRELYVAEKPNQLQVTQGSNMRADMFPHGNVGNAKGGEFHIVRVPKDPKKVAGSAEFKVLNAKEYSQFKK